MSKEALERVKKFELEAKANKRQKANKKAVKKLDKRSKLSPKAKVRKAHDKIEDRLDRLAKKYKVSIKLNRNKNKLPSVVVSGLKKLAYEDTAKLFNEIPNSSPVPQKMNGNSALFRIFTKRKITASDNSKFVITAMRAGRRMFWTDEGFKAVKASEASRLGEELADKIERRARAKGWDVKTVPAQMTAADDATTYTLKVNDGDGSLWSLLEFLKKCGSDGHSVSFTIDDQSFGFDGDGADKIYELTKGNSMEADDGSEDTDSNSSTDDADSNGDSDGGDTDNGDDSGDEESDEEVAANKANIVEFANKNGITRDDLMPLTQEAMDAYSSDVMDNAPVEDLVDLIYDMLGPDETKTSVRAIVNKKSMTTDTSDDS